MLQPIDDAFLAVRVVSRPLQAGIFGWFVAGVCALSPVAFAQDNAETPPIVETVAVTAIMEPSCAFWLDRTWMSLGAYEGEGLLTENAVNFRCSVLPANLNGEARNFAPVCFDAGDHFQAQADPNDRLSPRSLVVEGGEAGNPNHRLDYVILNRAQSNLVPNPTGSLGTGLSYQVCRDANPGGNHHPGFLLGWEVGPGGQFDEVANTTYSLPIYFYVLESAQQRGMPVPGNYSDTVTVYFVFKDP